MREGAKLAGMVLAALLLSGCPMTEMGVRQEAREYFPNAIVYTPLPSMLHLETCVGNVSEKMGREAMQQFTQGARGNELRSSLQSTGYRYFTLGFNEFNVVWDTQTGQYWTFTMDQRGALQFVQWASTRYPQSVYMNPARPPQRCSPAFPR
ncbi:MAG: hypothetical protein L0212_00715 [Acidobacteria bacterium]|nr:hypothetical protein [Acidobacteriota bacterium]